MGRLLQICNAGILQQKLFNSPKFYNSSCHGIRNFCTRKMVYWFVPGFNKNFVSTSRPMLNIHGVNMNENGTKRWRKILYEDQGVPDNYVDESFLDEMKKNRT